MLKAVVLSAVMTLSSPLPVDAKAPHCDGGELTAEQSRVPAQNAQGKQFPKIDDYLDMNCKQLTDENSKDEFIIFFRKEMKSLNPDLCSIVTDESYEDQFASQAERKTIGLGTFSKLVEVHFNDFIYDKKLSHYQDLDCHSLMNSDSHDAFVRHFAQKMEEEGINLCSSQNEREVGFDDDRSQAEMPIGRGTISKMVEIYYEQYHYSQL